MKYTIAEAFNLINYPPVFQKYLLNEAVVLNNERKTLFGYIMKYVIMILLGSLFFQPEQLSIDFGTDKVNREWRVINDGVMGGLSEGQISFTSNTVRFAGTVSLANNGGFSSFRSPFQKMDLGQYKSVSLRIKTKGIACSFVMETNRRFYVPNYKQKLLADSEGWTELELPLADFKQYQLGRPTGNKLTQKAKGEIIRIGFITDEKREGPFQLEVDYIRFND